MKRSTVLVLASLSAIGLVFIPAVIPAGPTSSLDASSLLASGRLFVAAGVIFLGGFLTSLTPCVYPLIPITVGVFGARQAESKGRAVVLTTSYVFGMGIVFSALGIFAAFSGRAFGSVLGNTWVLAGLAVFMALAETIAAPTVDVTYVFYECEEVAARFNGLKKLLSSHASLLAGDAAILGEPTQAVIEAGCQGTMRAQLSLGGIRAHTARPWMGRNAIHRLGVVLDRLHAYEGRRPVIDGCEFREAIQAVRVEGGVAGNVVPDRAMVTINHRFAPDRTPAEAEAHLRSVIGADLLDDDATFEVVDSANAASPSLTHPLLRGLADRLDAPPRAKLGWTDVAFFAAQGIPAVNFGPGDPSIAHSAGEHVHRAEIEQAYAVLASLLSGAGPA